MRMADLLPQGTQGLSGALQSASPLLMAMGQGLSSGQGVGAYMPQGMAAMMNLQKMKKDEKERQEAQEQVASIFGGMIGGVPQMGGPMATMPPPVSSGSLDGKAIAGDAMKALGRSPMAPYREAIASIESRGSGDYQAVGPTHSRLGRALGRYQIMEANIGPWSREILGRELTPEQFMANPRIQDAIFDGKFAQYVQKFGPQGAAQAWFGGEGGVGKVSRRDSLGTSIGQYTEKFNSALGGSDRQLPGLTPERAAAIVQSPYVSDAVKQMVVSQFMPQGPEPTDDIREYEFARRQGFGGSFQDWMLANRRAGATSITNNMGQSTKPIGTKGAVLVEDPNSSSGYRVEHAENSEAAREAAAASSAKEGDAAQARDMIGLIDSVLTDPAFESVVGQVQGRLPAGIPGVTGGQAGTDVNVKLRQIGGKAFLEAFETLKGGGQITEREGQAAKDAIARLDRAQSEEAYRAALAELRELANRALRRANGESVPDVKINEWRDVGGVRVREKP